MTTNEHVDTGRATGSQQPDVPGTALGRATLLALSQGVVVMDRHSRILLVNPAAERILGRDAAHMSTLLVGDDAWRAVREDGTPFPGAEHPANVVLTTGREVRDVVMGLHRTDGSFVWIWINAVPVEGAPVDGAPAVVATFADITDELTLRHELISSERRFRMLAENSADLVVRTGADGLIDWVSPSILAVLGWEPEEWIGRRLVEFLHPEDQVKAPQQIRASVVGGTGKGLGEARFATAAGGWRWMSGTGSTLRDTDGTIVGGVDSLRDIHAEVQARQSLAESEERYRLLAENATDVVVRAQGGVLTWVSPSLTAALGWKPEEWLGRPVADVVHPDDRAALRAMLASPPEGGSARARRRVLDSDHQYHWVESHHQTYIDADGRADGIIATLHVIDDQVEVQRELDRRARYDELTGLLNRAEVIERLTTILAHPRRAGLEIAVAFCDVDDFHHVNETHGHGGGDEALRVLAARFTSVVREDDLVARFGGDEILVVLPGVRDLRQAVGVAEKLRAQARLPIPVLGGTFPVSASIGVTLARMDESADSLIARADEAMFAAKSEGKDRVVAFDDPTCP